MVWIHGGAFELGSTAEPREEGTNFVHENPDVVLVSIEYRLNILGFVHLSHLPDGADYPDAQNLGLLDQMMALKWVHESIAAFGGDPDNVTIWGESAGGGSVTTLPLIEGSHKYFHRIIAQSGSPCLTRSTEQAIECTNEWMEALGCKTVADLQKVDVDKLVLTASTHLGLRIWPERDGRTVPLNPYDAWADGAVRDMEILHGCNKDEVGVFIWGMGREFFLAYAEDRKAKKMELLTEEEKALVESYCADAKDVSPDYSSSCRLIDQIVFVAPLFRLSEIQTKAGGAVYTYFFTPESSVPLFRSGHGVELNTVFNHPEELRVAGRPFDETFSKTVRKMWVQFAKCGNPSLTAEQSPDGKAKEWPAYDPENRYMMVLDEFDIHPEREAERELLDWERTYFLTKHYFI